MGYWIYELETDTFYGSDGLYEIYGFKAKPGEIVPLEEFFEVLHPDDREQVATAWGNASKEMKEHISTHRLMPRPGEPTRCIHVIGHPRENASGKIEYFGFAQDVTELTLLAEKLKQSEQNLQQGLDIAKMGYWVYNLETETFFGSSGLYEIYGIQDKPGDLVSLEKISALFYPDDRDIVATAWKDARENLLEFKVTHRISPRSDFPMRYVQVIGRPRKNASGETEYVGFIQDITEQKELENQLRQSERNFRESLDIAKMAYWVCNPKRNSLYGSDELYRMYGLEDRMGEVVDLGAVFTKIMHPDDQERVTRVWEKSLKENGEHDVKHRLLPLSGAPMRHVHVTGRPRKNADGEVEYVGFILDITEQTRLENQLRRSEHHFREAAKLAGLIRWEYNREKKAFYVDTGDAPPIPFLQGRTEIPADEVFATVPDDERQNAISLITDDANTERSFDFTYKMAVKERHKTWTDDMQSDKTWLHIKGWHQVNESGKSKVAGFTQDVTKMIGSAEEIARLNSELDVASDLQRSFLPDVNEVLAKTSAIQLAARLKPALKVGGDFYDFTMLDEKRLYFVIGDVADKGMPAALFGAKSISLLRHLTTEYQQPHEILQKLNEEIARDNPTMNFITMLCGIFDLESRTLNYANAGHLPPILIPKTGAPLELDLPPCPSVGVFADIDFTSNSYQLEPGDILLTYTDGIVETERERNIFFGEKRLFEFCDKNKALPPNGFLEELEKVVEKLGAQHTEIPYTVLKGKK